MASRLSLQAAALWVGIRCAHPMTGPYLILKTPLNLRLAPIWWSVGIKLSCWTLDILGMGLPIGERWSRSILSTTIDDNLGSLLSYGAQITTLKAPAPGQTVPLSLTEAALTGQNYKLIIVTHVDTSTGESVENLPGFLRRYLLDVQAFCPISKA